MAPSTTPPPASALIAARDDPLPLYKEPIVGMVLSVILAMGSVAILSNFITRRFQSIKSWLNLPYVQWLVFCIYVDSFLFVYATGILQFGLGVNFSLQVCTSAILLCLVFYVTTKLIYLFLVEKVHIIRASKRPRFSSKLYLFNSFGMMGVYLIVVVLNFIFRITEMVDGQCIIGMRRLAMIPLIGFDLLVNVYLTVLFLIPLSSLYTYKNFQKTPANIRLRTVAFRTFVGSVCTLMSSIINLSVLMGLDGEPGWICLMCCNCDILFSAIVLHWVTMPDRDAAAADSTNSYLGNGEELSDVARQRKFGTDRARGTSTIASGGAGGGVRRHTLERRGSDASIESSHVASSTKAIVDDIASISRDPTAPADRAAASPSSRSSRTFYEEAGGPHHHRTTHRLSTAVREMDDEHDDEDSAEHHARGTVLVPPPNTLARSAIGVPPAVHVHVDYGSEVTSKPANTHDAALGNTVTIATGDEGIRRPRGNSRHLTHHGEAI